MEYQENSNDRMDLTLKLSSTRTLSVVKKDGSILAKITNEETGQGMTLGWGALTKLMASVPFVTRAREALITKSANERFGKIPRLPLKRKLDFDAVHADDTPIRPSLVPLALPLHMNDDSPIRPSQWSPMTSLGSLERDLIRAPPKKRRSLAEAEPVGVIDLTGSDDESMEC